VPENEQRNPQTITKKKLKYEEKKSIKWENTRFSKPCFGRAGGRGHTHIYRSKNGGVSIVL